MIHSLALLALALSPLVSGQSGTGSANGTAAATTAGAETAATVAPTSAVSAPPTNSSSPLVAPTTATISTSEASPSAGANSSASATGNATSTTVVAPPVQSPSLDCIYYLETLANSSTSHIQAVTVPPNASSVSVNLTSQVAYTGCWGPSAAEGCKNGTVGMRTQLPGFFQISFDCEST